MDINIFNDRKNKSATVRIIADDPVMEELIETVLSPFCSRTERNAVLTVVCTEDRIPDITGPCVFVGIHPEKMVDGQTFMPRPLDIEKFSEICLGIIRSTTVATKSGWGVDPQRRVAVFEDREISLTQRETELFLLLLGHIGECVSREEMESALWNGETAGNCADVYVCYLRKKLESIAGPGVLISVRGRGYMLKKP